MKFVPRPLLPTTFAEQKSRSPASVPFVRNSSVRLPEMVYLSVRVFTTMPRLLGKALATKESVQSVRNAGDDQTALYVFLVCIVCVVVYYIMIIDGGSSIILLFNVLLVLFMH